MVSEACKMLGRGRHCTLNSSVRNFCVGEWLNCTIRQSLYQSKVRADGDHMSARCGGPTLMLVYLYRLPKKLRVKGGRGVNLVR